MKNIFILWDGASSKVETHDFKKCHFISQTCGPWSFCYRSLLSTLFSTPSHSIVVCELCVCVFL